MLTCSIKETCKIWIDLWDCLHGRNGFGSSVCEIYSYRLQKYSPFVHGSALQCDKELEKRETYRDAARSLMSILREFCREYNCGATIDDVNPDKWYEEIGLPGCFEHRCHIAITKEQV